jgi:hypothetical protein
MSQELSYAVIYEGNNAPLLKQQEQKVNLEFGKFKRSSLFLGLMVGFFIQFSTLGANYLVISIWGEEVLSSSKQDIVIFSLLWSFFTSTMAIVILAFLRNLVSSTYSRESPELDDMILHMECSFVVGALVGVCVAWAATDVILGMSAQIVYSLVTLVIALAWCRIMMYFFTKANDEEENNLLIDV